MADGEYGGATVEGNLKKNVARRIARLTGEDASLVESRFEVPRDRGHGDLALPCFFLARTMRKDPSRIAAGLAEDLEGTIPGVSFEAAGPYLNLRIDAMLKTSEVLEAVRCGGTAFGRVPGWDGKTVVIDFSHPNIAKPFGVGHLRSTVIGNALANLYAFLGARVVKINHLGDWGKQFGLLDVAYRLWGDEGKLDEDPIMHLYELYVRINKRIEEGDADLDEQGREAFRRLEQGEEEYVRRWKLFRDLSVREFKRVYARLEISFDSYKGEAFFNERMKETIERMRKAGILVRSEGADVVDLRDEELGVAIIRKSNGSTTYLTRDVAAAEYRYETYGFDRMLYVVGQPQELHFKQLFAILRRMGYPWVERMEHVRFGYIKGMSTRRGTIVFLDDVLDEAKERVLKKMEGLYIQKVKEEERERIAEEIGITAVVFSDLKNRRIKDVEFDWDRILSLQGDTGPYLQSVLARIYGIFRKVGDPPSGGVDYSLLGEEKARELVDLLGLFPAAVEEAAREREPSVLTGYLLKLAASFHSAYTVLPVKGSEENVARARLRLFDCVRQVFENGFRILGFRIVREM